MLAANAKEIWNNLRGVICVYKPAGIKCNQIRKSIINAVCSGLDKLEVRPPGEYIQIEGDTTKELNIVKKVNLADDVLVVGPRYQFGDVSCSWSSYLGPNTSGVLLLGINDGTKAAKIIRENRLARTYKVRGILGEATDTYFKDGKVVERSTFRFIKLSHIEKLLTSMQAAHQKKMFELCGVDNQSQAAYELAIRGLIRPASSKIPVLYGIKCVNFQSPQFTIEVQCINEYEMYLKTLIHDIGVQLHSTAYCSEIQCIRHGHFTIDDALLRKHWTLENIYTNMEEMNKKLLLHEDMLRQNSPILQ
ncbi:mitochondrial mRNA pseudouridine synthase Trub2 [Agrilus planipennis]|uniref:Mitochondrial mRNA pseudouridine synthase Trub2 n=1 Tax=Agrilus planipennis TaxID=224129 RepID=A0A7F5R241_AGRPL|nr:mitochondrial mRNA pseudouridine synthase Trub2 [Agrilus planipennis]